MLTSGSFATLNPKPQGLGFGSKVWSEKPQEEFRSEAGRGVYPVDSFLATAPCYSGWTKSCTTFNPEDVELLGLLGCNV